mmetsp:Transcript_16091/g.31453  ORF Transcript_16091/g.31453 Transcript_16091/m.31453 type:complete len:206 (+) Transcript_16091:97-714(+)
MKGLCVLSTLHVAPNCGCIGTPRMGRAPGSTLRICIVFRSKQGEARIVGHELQLPRLLNTPIILELAFLAAFPKVLIFLPFAPTVFLVQVHRVADQHVPLEALEVELLHHVPALEQETGVGRRHVPQVDAPPEHDVDHRAHDVHVEGHLCARYPPGDQHGLQGHEGEHHVAGQQVDVHDGDVRDHGEDPREPQAKGDDRQHEADH